MFVEVTRLLTVLLCTAAGFLLGGHSAAGGTGHTALVGAGLGACVGYVVGGAGGRLLRRAWGHAERRIERLPPAQVMAGALGAVALGGAASLMCVPALLLLPSEV